MDIAARGDTPTLHRVLSVVSKNQGMPLSMISASSRIASTEITPAELTMIQALAREGIIKPPTIKRPNKTEEKFIFTPSPGRTRMSAANREIYEKAMALAAAVRKGQLLPEAIRIRSPQALLNALEERKWLRANTEAAHQYKNLAVLGLGRLERTSDGWFRFHLIDVPENIEAVQIARNLLRGEQPTDAEVDKAAQILLARDESYVRSHLGSASLRKLPQKPVFSNHAQLEIEEYLLRL